jgi:hypothetical protein
MIATPAQASGPSRLAGAPPVRSCGHLRHVGTCAACQRAQLARWRAQLSDVEHLAQTRVSEPPPASSYIAWNRACQSRLKTSTRTIA